MAEFGGEEGPEGTWNLGGARITGLVLGGGRGGATAPTIAGVDGYAVAPSTITHSSSSSIVIVDVIDPLCDVIESV
jgi:hypothetical protein